MCSHRIHLRATLAAIALAAVAAVYADEDDDAFRLKTPESRFVFGAGYLFDDAQRFGQYTGLREEGVYGLLDADWVNRDDATGTWLHASGRNLGLEHREANLEWSRQGAWGITAAYSEIPRYSPYAMNTALAGIGSNDLTVGGTALDDVQLKTRRQIFALGGAARILQDLDVKLNFRHEQKDGARQFARGTPGAMEFLAEPIDQTMQQMEATLGYTGPRLQLAGGYYATAFDNADTALNITGGAPALSGGANPFTPIALPPDNRSHQLYLSGGYSFTQNTRGTFKASYSRLSQDDDFILPSVTGRTDLGGRVDVTQFQGGVTARPLQRLTLLANVRYEDRHDKTPIARYFTGATPTSTFNGDNEPRSIRGTTAKAEAAYSLPWLMRITAGVDYEEKTRNSSPVRVVTAREETRELSYRAELRRSLNETLSGALSFVRSDREGSPFLTTVLNNGTAGSNLVAPLHLADRDRDKLRLLLNWAPLEALSVQVVADDAKDEYGGRALGLQSGRARLYSLDATYMFTDDWQATAWGSRGQTRAEQLTQVNAPAGQFWSADLRNHDDALGLDIRGKFGSRLDVGAGAQHFEYRDEYRTAAVTGAPLPSIPDVFSRQTTLNFFATYELRKNTGIRLDLVHDRWHSDDWTWTNWVYTDGTRVVDAPDQKTVFVALSGYLKVW